MKRAASVIRRVNSIDQLRHHVRTTALTRNFTTPTCQRCAIPIYNAEQGRFEYHGPPLVRVEYTHQGKSPGGRPCVEIVGFCDRPEHQGCREDAIRADFDYEPDDDDIDSVMRSLTFFPRDTQMDAGGRGG